jgi:hypothetical protein
LAPPEKLYSSLTRLFNTQKMKNAPVLTYDDSDEEPVVVAGKKAKVSFGSRALLSLHG